MEMFKADTQKDGETLQAFCEALKTGNAGEVERLFNGYLEKTISIRDTFVRKPTKENYYHGILIGILGFKGDWYVKSNKECGDGYSDILVEGTDWHCHRGEIRRRRKIWRYMPGGFGTD